MIQELDGQGVQGLLRFNKKAVAVFIHTPLCGTCKLAGDMLTIVDQSLQNVSIYRVNLNLMPSLSEKWEVTSVPCLAILEQDQVTHKMYAMHSVAEMYEWLAPLQHSDANC